MNEKEFNEKLINVLLDIENRMSEHLKASQLMSEMIKINNDLAIKMSEMIKLNNSLIIKVKESINEEK